MDWAYAHLSRTFGDWTTIGSIRSICVDDCVGLRKLPCRDCKSDVKTREKTRLSCSDSGHSGKDSNKVVVGSL